MTDADLVLRARGGDELAFRRLLDRHGDLIRLKARDYFAPGAERADLHQEALFGFHKAVCDFRTGQGSGFRNFAELCIRRQLITAVKTATRQKHAPLNFAASLSQPFEVGGSQGEEASSLEEVLIDGSPDPADRSIIQEKLQEVGIFMRERLSEREAAVLIRHAEGYSYEEIGEQLGIPWKGVDSTLTRIRWKQTGVSPASHPEAAAASPEGDLGYRCPKCDGPTRKRHRRGRPPLCVICIVTQPSFRLARRAA